MIFAIVVKDNSDDCQLVKCRKNCHYCLFFCSVNKQDETSTYQLSVFLEDIRGIFRRNEGFNISHTFKEANQCTYNLAKMGARSYVSFCIWEDPLKEVRLCLLVDYASIVVVKT